MKTSNLVILLLPTSSLSSGIRVSRELPRETTIDADERILSPLFAVSEGQACSIDPDDAKPCSKDLSCIKDSGSSAEFICVSECVFHRRLLKPGH